MATQRKEIPSVANPREKTVRLISSTILALGSLRIFQSDRHGVLKHPRALHDLELLGYCDI